MLKSYAQRVSKQAKAKRGWCNKATQLQLQHVEK